MEQMGPATSPTERVRGGSILELALIAPWYIFLFIGVFDWGFYSHALVSVEAAVRTAALNASANSAAALDNEAACALVRAEMQTSVNLAGVTDCGSLPLIVNTTTAPGPDNRTGARVTVTYRTQNLVPIPGILSGQVTFTRTVQMRLRG